MWELRRLTTLWASTSCHTDSVTILTNGSCYKIIKVYEEDMFNPLEGNDNDNLYNCILEHVTDGLYVQVIENVTLKRE
jgi:DNA-binding protein Fis